MLQYKYVRPQTMRMTPSICGEYCSGFMTSAAPLCFTYCINKNVVNHQTTFARALAFPGVKINFSICYSIFILWNAYFS